MHLVVCINKFSVYIKDYMHYTNKMYKILVVYICHIHIFSCHKKFPM